MADLGQERSSNGRTPNGSIRQSGSFPAPGWAALDPKRAFPNWTPYGRSAPESCRRRYGQVAPRADIRWSDPRLRRIISKLWLTLESTPPTSEGVNACPWPFARPTAALVLDNLRYAPPPPMSNAR